MNLRERIFRAGVVLLAADIALYVIGVLHIQLIAPDTSRLARTLHIAAIYFFAGSLIAILAAIFSCFGYGWKRLLLALASLITLPFWVGFTLY